MADTKRHLIDHVFKGGRFDDHGVDVAALPDLIAFRDLVVETAKELWRRRNPRRQRLPKGFESSILIKFYEVRPGSAAIPLYREYVEPPPPLAEAMDMHDEIDDAVDVIATAVRDLASGGELPSKFPLSVVGRLSSWGKSLTSSESIELRHNGDRVATLGKSVRDRIDRLVDPAVAPPTERPFDVTGMVTMARIRNPRMAVALDDGRELEMPFNEADEEKITRALYQRTSVHIRVTGTAEFDSSGILHRPLTVDAVEIVPASQATSPTVKPPLWLTIEELMADVSDDEMSKVPPADSRAIDEKLYGKKP